MECFRVCKSTWEFQKYKVWSVDATSQMELYAGGLGGVLFFLKHELSLLDARA